MSAEELSKRYYNAILEAERGLLLIPSLFSKPKIETTAQKSAKFRADMIVPDGTTNKTFSDDGAYNYLVLPVAFLAVIFMIWMVFLQGELIQLWVKILISLVLVAVVVVGATQLTKPDPRVQIQMDTRTITIEGYIYPWDYILETYLIRRAGRYGYGPEILALLLKNGQVHRFELVHYSSVIGICRYIEYFKKQRLQS